jgi:hypothetical protein
LEKTKTHDVKSRSGTNQKKTDSILPTKLLTLFSDVGGRDDMVPQLIGRIQKLLISFWCHH